MGREIKFRAWLNDEQRMIPWSRLWLELEDRYGGVFEQGGRKDTTSDFELMQYTGLRDKNGTEIYEGDIVYKDGFVPAKVEFHGLRWYPALICMDCEVIGNIYENADLLAK